MTTAPRPRLRIREAVPADGPAIADLHFAAFSNNVMNKIMYPSGTTPASKTSFASSILAKTPPDGQKGEYVLMVVELVEGEEEEEDKGEVVAAGRWLVHREPRPREEWDVETVATRETLGESCDPDVYNTFIGGLHRITRRHAKGDPALFLKLLVTRPDRQRIGAGAALMQWGADFADKLGLPTFLESSPVGYRLYRRFGFEDLEVQDLPVAERWGAVKEAGVYWGENNAVELAGPAPEGVMRSVIMRRPAKV